jgi:hypothetical protein
MRTPGQSSETSLIDDESGNHGALVSFQQFTSPQQRSEDAAAINVSNEQTLRIRHFGHAHIHNVIVFKIDLGWGAGSLQDHDIILFGKDAIALFNDRQEFGNANFLIVAGIKVAPHLAAYDNLRGGVATGLDKNWIHVHRRGNSGGFRLQRLRASDLVSVRGGC